MTKFASRLQKLIAVCFLSTCFYPIVQAQTLDQKAYNAVWDRLERLAGVSNASEEVHVLQYVTPATWGSGTEEGLRELQRIAGAIPSNNFKIDPSVRTRLLHEIYASFVADLDLPKVPPKQEKAFLAASARYGKAVKAAEARSEEFEKLWQVEEKDIVSRNEEVTTLKKVRFRDSHVGFFDEVEAELDSAENEVQQFSPVAGAWVKALRRLRSSLNATMSGSTAGIWTYQASFAGMQVMNDCAADGPGWTKWILNRAVSSERTRTGQFYAGGGWNAGFFSIDGSANGSDYSHVLATDGESITIGFCNLQYMPVSPSDWFDIDLLQAIDEGSLSLKPNSPNYRKVILGPDGRIPRLVKGLIVARRMQIDANLSSTSLDEYKRHVSGSSGVRIGPWNVGGGGGFDEFTKVSQSASGGYVRSTDTTVPVIIAVVTETTADAKATVKSGETSAK
jgi:hypothetical protein